METRRRLPCWRYLAIVQVALSLVALSAQASDADSLIQSLKERRAKIKSLHTVTTTNVHNRKGVRKTVFEYWEMKTEKSRKTRRVGRSEVTGDGKARGGQAESLTVSDGTHEWSQLPGANGEIIVKSEARYEDELDQVSDALKSGKARTKPGGKILGFDSVVVEVVGDAHGTSYKATFWLSEKHGVILRSSIRHADGDGMEVETTTCEINGDVSKDIFTYSPPKGAQVIDTASIGRGETKSGRP